MYNFTEDKLDENNSGFVRHAVYIQAAIRISAVLISLLGCTGNALIFLTAPQTWEKTRGLR